MEISSYLTFVVASLVLAIVPGPAVLYILARTLADGWKAGLASAFGAASGVWIHIFASVAGIGIIIAHSIFVFTAMKIIGGVYLLYLAVTTIFSAKKKFSFSDTRQTTRTLKKDFSDGFITSVFNPKTALFFIAFLPQFVVPGSSNISYQLLFLGLTYLLVAVISDSVYVLVAGGAHAFLTRSQWVRKALQYISAGIYFILGALFLGFDRKSSS